MAAEAVGVLMAAVAARHMVVEVAVHTAIVKISAFQERPAPPQRGGPFAFFLSEADPEASAQLSLRSRV
jgi:hypothetical protein